MARLSASDTLATAFFLLTFTIMTLGWWHRDQLVWDQAQAVERLQLENERLRRAALNTPLECGPVEVTCACPGLAWEDGAHADHAEECEPLSEDEIRSMCDIFDFYGNMPGC